MGRTSTKPGLPSVRLVSLLEGDLPDYRRETTNNGRIRFVPTGDGLILEVASRIEKRFLGRTEIAVFESDLGSSLPEKATIELRHTGGIKRSGVTAALVEGGDAAQRIAEELASDARLADAVISLDFTRFEVHGDPTGCRARVELMGASHVAIALPPVRSYIHLYPDQLDAMTEGFAEVRRVLRSV